MAYASFIGPARETVWEFGKPPDHTVTTLGMDGSFMQRDYQEITAASSPPTFEATENQPNAWTIRLPDELSRAVREKLKAETKK